MKTPRSRTRAVIFRLNQDEFNQLQAACMAIGARSLSDFVRTRVLRATNEPEFAHFERKLDDVNLVLSQLIRLVAEEEPEVSGSRLVSTSV